MSNQTNTRQLISEVGPLLELDAVLESDDGNGWLLVVDEDDAVTVELDDARNRIVMSADAGTPDEGDRTKLYELLLVYNALWQTTGGVRMALDGPGGQVVQLFELPLEGLEPEGLAEVLTNFLEIRLGWLRVVSAMADGTPPSDASEMLPPGAIEV